ncbi:DUF3800 domain-containing protein [Neobacillus cucumis]|uniref:DUF3800 domain-containing protein n=1 Tax=Neobacillus cucumis TaxID=1740721 RepID=UPI001963904C|nr:DUF3800 domain-containing protein [Neobacillus cucumis]MBM7651058.1 hypothetical protein [Neobacillus cucumis]
MEEIQYAFIDEFGDYRFDFDKGNGSSHFIIVSILLKESNKQYLEYELGQISQKYFQTGTIDTSIVDDAPTQTLQLINDLKDLPFSIYAYVIDKRKIREDHGILFKTPFLKYLNRKIYDDLNRTFEQLDLASDEHESKLFLREFKNYIQTRSIPDLFNYSTFGFNHTQSELLLQLANLVTKILATGYERNLYSEQYRSFSKIFKSKIAAINLLPLDYKNFLFDYQAEHDRAKDDEIIIKQAVNLAYKYIEKHRKSEEEEERLRLDFIKFLLFNLKENPDEYVYTEEILDNLNAIRDVKLTPHSFRSTIVSKLRDRGLLIASSNKGYKLPVSLNDLYDFVNLSSLTIHPMIQRIAKCRDQILLATNNEIDILEQKEYDYLKRIIDMDKLKI